MKKNIVAAATVLTLGFTLSACTVPESTVNSCTVGGATVDLVQVNDNIEKAPNPAFPYPLKADRTQMSFAVLGDGSRIQEHQIIRTRISIYSGSDGELIYDGNHTQMADPLFLLVNESTLIDSQFAESYGPLLCAPEGSRLVVTTPAEKVFGADELVLLDIEENDALIFVYDVIDSFLAKANGAERLVTDNRLPSVSYAPDGTPGLTFRAIPAPTEQIVVTLKQGSGPAVGADDGVAVHQSTFSWNNRSVTDTTWTSKTPTVVSLGQNAKELIPDDALTGVTVGSQLMIVTPDAESDDASIVIVDILGTL